MLISEAFEAYALDVIAFKGQSVNTEYATNACRNDLISNFGDVDIQQLTFVMVRQWKLKLDKRVSPATSREYVIRLRVVLAYLQSRKLDVLDSKLVPVPKRPERIPEFISKEDVAQFIEVALKPSRGYPATNRVRNAAMISLIYSSGIRISEMCSLNRSDIREDGSFSVVGKGKKVRLCFTDSRTIKLLQVYSKHRTDNSPALFISNENETRVKPNNVQRVFRILSAKIGLDTPIHPHVLRHSFATNLLKNNCNIRYVQELLGHSSLETTQMYTHVVNADLQRVYEQFHTV